MFLLETMETCSDTLCLALKSKIYLHFRNVGHAVKLNYLITNSINSVKKKLKSVTD